MGEDEMWAALQANTGTYENAKINWNHIPLATTSTAGAIKVGSTLAISNGILNQATIPNLTADVYTKVTVDTYGRVTQGGDLLADDIPSLSWNKITSDKPTTLLGYGITNAYTKAETDNALSGYLPLSGGTLQKSSVDTPLYIKSTNKYGAYIGFKASDDSSFGFIGVRNNNVPAFVYNGNVYDICRISGCSNS